MQFDPVRLPNSTLLYNKIGNQLLKTKRRATVDTPEDLDSNINITKADKLKEYFPLE